MMPSLPTCGTFPIILCSACFDFLHPGRDAARYGVLDQDPRCFAIAVLQTRRRRTCLMEYVMDCADQVNGVSATDLDRFDADPQHAARQPAVNEKLSVSHRPYPSFYADSISQERPHDLKAAVLGQIDCGVVSVLMRPAGDHASAQRRAATGG
jgi:hypothetical protein